MLLSSSDKTSSAEQQQISHAIVSIVQTYLTGLWEPAQSRAARSFALQSYQAVNKLLTDALASNYRDTGSLAAPERALALYKVRVLACKT